MNTEHHYFYYVLNWSKELFPFSTQYTLLINHFKDSSMKKINNMSTLFLTICMHVLIKLEYIMEYKKTSHLNVAKSFGV